MLISTPVIRGCCSSTLIVVQLVAAACSSSGPTEYLGIHLVRVDHVEVPDSIFAGDVLVALYIGRPEIGDCFRFARADIQNDSIHAEITIWAHADRWIGSGPPPPCGIVDYQYTRTPPFIPGWFELRVRQPGDVIRVDSVRVVPDLP